MVKAEDGLEPVQDQPGARTLSMKKISKFLWFDDDEDRFDKIDKKQKILYNLILCGQSKDDDCKKITKLAMKLFKQVLGDDDDDDDDDDIPQPRPPASTLAPAPPTAVFVTVRPTITDTPPTTTATRTTAIPIPANAVPLDPVPVATT